MDFNIQQVKKDIAEAKNLLQTNFLNFHAMELIGQGTYAKVSRFKNAAVRCEKFRLAAGAHLPGSPLISDQNAEHEKRVQEKLLKSELGIKQGINFAPTLDYIVEDKTRNLYLTDGQKISIPRKPNVIYQLMPFIKGSVPLPENTVDCLLKIGREGFEKYLHDWAAINRIGLEIDDENTENIIISDKYINFIDLDNMMPNWFDKKTTNPKYEMYRAANYIRNILEYSSYYLKKNRQEQNGTKTVNEKIKTIKSNFTNALKKVKNNNIALSYLNVVRKADNEFELYNL